MATALVPGVIWAQRSSASDENKNLVYLTVEASDLVDPKIEIDEQSVSLDGTTAKGKSYKLRLELCEKIDPKESSYHLSARNVEFILRKAEKKADYWPRLIKSTKKEHFIHTDFAKWVDEDEQDEKPDAGDFGMPGMSGMSGMPGMSGMQDMDFSNFDPSKYSGMGGDDDMEGDYDSDDEDLPNGESDMPSLENPDKDNSVDDKGKAPASADADDKGKAPASTEA